jgi:hypothetical protein
MACTNDYNAILPEINEDNKSQSVYQTADAILGEFEHILTPAKFGPETRLWMGGLIETALRRTWSAGWREGYDDARMEAEYD